MALQVNKNRMNQLVLVFLITIAAVCLILPFLWMISTSFKVADEIFTQRPRWIPSSFKFINYKGIWSRPYFPTYLLNSIIVSLVTMFVSLVVAVLAGYGISRFTFKGRTAFSVVLLVVQMFPVMLLLIPMYIIMQRLKLLNSHASMIIAYTTFAMPFCTWMLKGYFDTIPESLEEAARIEGYGRFRILIHIVVPLSAPGIVTVAMFAFVLSWQEYLYALTFARTEEMRTLTVGLSLMQGQHGSINWGEIMSGSVIACIPGLILFLYLEKYLVKGFTMGALKE